MTGDTCAHELGHNIINNLSHSENRVFNNSIQVSSSQTVTFSIPIQFVLGGNSDDQGVLTTNSGDRYQAAHFGSGLTDEQTIQLSQDLVKLIGLVDDEDLNETVPVHEDADVNRILHSIMRRRGWKPNDEFAQHINVLPASMIMTSDETQDIANMVSELKSSGTWDKIHAMYLPVFRDTNVNKINFKCPDSNNIETWNALEQSDSTYAGFTRAELLSHHYNLLSNSTIPTPKAMYSADQIDQELGSMVHTWMDLTGNGNHLTSKPNPLALPPEDHHSPVLVDDADTFDKKIGVRFNNRSHRLVFDDGNQVNRDDFKHVFIVYRMDNWVNNGRRGTMFEFGQSNNYTAATLGLGHDDFDYGCPTRFYGSWSISQLNGWNASLAWPAPYYNRWRDRWNGGYSNYGLLTHYQGTYLRTVGDDPTWLYGPRIVHVMMSSSQPEQLSGFTLGNNSSDANGCSVRGSFHDVIIYDQELTTEQVNYVTSYLAMKHDVSIHPEVTNNRSILHNKQQNNSVTFARDVHNGVATPFTISEAFPDQSGGVMIIKSLADRCVARTYDIGSDWNELHPYIGATSSLDKTPPGLSMQNFSSSGVDTIISPGLTPDSQTSSAPAAGNKKIYMMGKKMHFSNWRAKPANASSDSYTGFYFFNQQLTTQQIQSVARSHQLLMKSMGGSTADGQDTPYDSDGEISAYVGRVASKTGKTYDEMIDDPRITSVIDFIKRGKSIGWWDRIAVCYFPVWRDQELNELNLKSPGEYGSRSGGNVDHCRGPWAEAIGNTGGGNWFVPSINIPVNIPTIHTLCCQPGMNIDDWTTMHYHFTVHYKQRHTALSWGNANYTGFGTGNTMIRVHPFRYTGYGNTSIDWGCNSNDGGAFKYQTSGTYFESVEGVGDIYSKWNDTTVIRSRDCSTNITPVTTGGFSLHPGGGHAGNQVDFFALGVKMDHTTEQDMIDDYIEAVDQLTATLIDTVSSAGAGTIAASTNPITIHGATNLYNTDQSAVLIAAKNDLTIYEHVVPESLETTSQPFTAIWDDDRIWNFSPGHNKHYGSIYTTAPNSINNTSLTPCEIGYRIRTQGSGYPGNYTQSPGGNIASSAIYGQNCFIRGRQSGAIRRSTFGYVGHYLNDSSTSGVSEDRILKFKILNDNPSRGLFIAGGSPPWRSGDISSWSGTTIYFPGNGSMTSQQNWFGSKLNGPMQDQFWNNLSNDISYIPGEPIDIVNFDNINPHSSIHSAVTNRTRGAPVQDNISFFNGKYRVAELTDLQQPLEDGDVFDSDNYLTYGGPDQPDNPGDGTPLRAWMRVEMSPIETIDIGPTNQHDLVLFANTTMSDSVSADWINRFYLGGVDEYKYKLRTDNKDNMFVCGTYRDHMIVNYNLDLNEKYSVVLDEFGAPQDEPSSSSSGENSQAFVTMHDPTSGQIVTCLSTRGHGKNRGSSAIADSKGDIYMVGQVSGKVRFVADHGWWKFAERGVNTGSTNNTFGFLAKATNREWMIDNSTKYKPIDYTWEWIVYIDAPEHSLSGERMLCDVSVSTNDDVYTVGYFNGPTEIGMSGAAKYNDSETFQFEPGYKWVDESDEQVFICKWSDAGKCVWSSVYGVTGLDHDNINIIFHDDMMYFVCAADTFAASTTESGVVVSCVDITTGDFTWVKSIQGGSITCSSIKVTDTGNIFITGVCDSTVTSSNITLGGGAVVEATSGYSLLLEPTGSSGVVTIFTSDSSTCDAVTQSTSTGRGVTIGTCDSTTTVQSGTQSIDIHTPEQNKYFIYKSTHEL